MTGEILDLSSVHNPADLDADVCVIGSGTAGATVAWELAKAKKNVIVLEEGADYFGPRMNQRDGAMYDQLYMERAGRATADLGITILQGRVLGGGGVINACDVVPFHEGTLRHWQRRYGLTGYTREALAPAEEAALRDLRASRPLRGELNRNNELLREGAEALGLRGEVMLHNRVGCIGLGTCLVGCPVEAKQNPRTVAIPAALGVGARFVTRARALRIEGASREVKTIRVRQLDPSGHHERGELAVRAKVVVLSANALNSTQLLLRSGIGNRHVGRHVSLQPQLPVTAVFDEEVRFIEGIPQAYAVTEWERHDDPEHGLWGFRIEAIAGTPGIVASLLPRLGHPGKALMKQYSHMGAVLCLTPDDPVGRIEVERSGRMRVHYTLTEEQKGRLRDAGRAAARIFLAAGAKEVLIPSVPEIAIRSEADLPKVDSLSLRPASVPLISAHQQGGVRMASSESDGAASPDGAVYGARGVFVVDSAGFPSTSSSHTMAPIMTVARFLAKGLV